MYPILPSVHSRGFSGNFQGSIAFGRAVIIAFYVHDGKAFFLIYVMCMDFIYVEEEGNH